jgi:hypothetical protein
MQIIIDGPDGSKVVDVVFSEISEAELRIYAKMNIAQAREELKNRIGFDPYKAVEDYTPADVKFYTRWKKNQTSATRDKIIVESSDEGSNE